MTSRKSPPRLTTNRVDSMARDNEPPRTRSPSSKHGLLNASAPTRITANVKTDKVRKNANGGVLITPEEIQMAFQLLDIDKTGQVSLNNLKKRLGVLFPELTVKDYRFLMNNKKELTIDDLKDLLLDNEITNFDPVAEAYKVFDANGEGALSGDRLREAFIAYGLGELADEELDILIRTADVDGDGAISLEDFRNMLDPAAVHARKASMIAVSPANPNPTGASAKAASGVQQSAKSPTFGASQASSKDRTGGSS